MMAQPMNGPSLDTIVNLAKRRGIAFQSSEIYGGLRSTWDYGPLGVELKDNVKRAWWKAMVQLREDVVGLDASILIHAVLGNQLVLDPCLFTRIGLEIGLVEQGRALIALVVVRESQVVQCQSDQWVPVTEQLAAQREALPIGRFCAGEIALVLQHHRNVVQ